MKHQEKGKGQKHHDLYRHDFCNPFPFKTAQKDMQPVIPKDTCTLILCKI